MYKGKLKDGRLAAIKVLKSKSKQGINEFLTEIQVISSIKHQNLVELLGCCFEFGHRILVYRYVENNSLAMTFLHRSSHSNINFSWYVRRIICVGIAQGLAFLHEEVHPYIIHRDIKPHNILLDANLRPIIADFGLAKLVDPNISHVTTHPKGTLYVHFSFVYLFHAIFLVYSYMHVFLFVEVTGHRRRYKE